MNSVSGADMQVLLDNIKFFGGLIISIGSLAITLLGIYLKLYVKNALLQHAEEIKQMIAEDYVRKDVHFEQMRRLGLRGTH